MKKKKIKFSVLTVFILLSVISIIIAMPIIGFKPKAETYTKCLDEEYYSETTYYLTEKAYKKHLKEIADESNRKSAAKSEISSDGMFVIAATKTIYVYEASDEDGNITESRLLKKSEVEQYMAECSNDSERIKPTSKIIITPIIDTSPKPLGSNSGNLYNLTIEISVVAEYSGTIAIVGRSFWSDEFRLSDEKKAESSSFDFIGLTWGGNGALRADEMTAHGEYYNGRDVEFSYNKYEAYAGLVWQFKEMNVLSPMRFATMEIKLNNIGAWQSKETDIRLTYIHTYDKTSGSLSLTGGTSGGSLGLTFSSAGSFWQIETAVPQIAY